MSSLADAVARLGAALPHWTLEMSAATGAVLAGALLADRLLERRVSAAVRMLLPLAVLARLALPAGWHSPLGLLGARHATSVVLGEPELGAITVVPVGAGPRSFGLGWLVVAYAVVTLVLLGRWLHARLALRRRLREATALEAVEGVRVARHPALGPLVAGLWRPVIVVPEALAAAGGEPLRWVLRHELAHVRRRDLLLGNLVQLACIAAWPIAPVWIAARHLRALMELACDEQVLHGVDGPGRRRYGELLLALATGRGWPLSPAITFGSPLRGRLRALSARRRWPVAVQALLVGAVGILCFACAGEPGGEDGPVVTSTDAEVDVAPVATPIARAPRRYTADGRHPPTLTFQYDGVLWLRTPRGGSVRVGDAQPLERAIREALAETGSDTLLIERVWSTSEQELARVLEAARRAGVKHTAVSTPNRDRPRLDRKVPTRPLDNPVVTISSDGALYLHGERFTPEELEGQLRRELAWSGSRTVLVRGSQDALRLRMTRDIFTLAERAGAKNLGILTEPQDGPPALATDQRQGSLDKSVIRRTVQDHMDEVRDCYERHRNGEPGPAGRLVVQFTISETGAVVASKLGDSTLGAPPIESCVVKAVRGWTFPRPAGGVVLVSYPFELAPAAGQTLKLPDDALRAAIASHTAEIQRDCTRHLLVSLPDGRVVFRFTILTSGEVSHVDADPGMEALEACVARHIVGTRVPRPPAISGPLLFDYPLVFPAR